MDTPRQKGQEMKHLIALFIAFTLFACSPPTDPADQTPLTGPEIRAVIIANDVVAKRQGGRWG